VGDEYSSTGINVKPHRVVLRIGGSDCGCFKLK
jgi:hypothetical protein